MKNNWYFVKNSQDIPSPALLIYPDRILENITGMIRMAGAPDKLWTHVKTHKMAEVVRLQISQGITRFKCSTIGEADVTAAAGAKDVMLAMQPVGIQIHRFFTLMRKYPATRFSVIVDDFKILKEICTRAESLNAHINLWVDINNGMNRTGIKPGNEAFRLYREIAAHPFCNVMGLHVYDGHIHEKDPEMREIRCEADFQPVNVLIADLMKSGLNRPAIVAGGTPTFPIHVKRSFTETSPGTCLLWDCGYSEGYADLVFLHAAVILTRVVSKPGNKLLCLDLGHKAIAAEMPHPRIRFFEMNVDNFINHSEEHLVVETSQASYSCGDLIYGIPWHICPTVPRYPFAYTVRDNQIDGTWKVDARDRIL